MSFPVNLHRKCIIKNLATPLSSSSQNSFCSWWCPDSQSLCQFPPFNSAVPSTIPYPWHWLKIFPKSNSDTHLLAGIPTNSALLCNYSTYRLPTGNKKKRWQTKKLSFDEQENVQQLLVETRTPHLRLQQIQSCESINHSKKKRQYQCLQAPLRPLEMTTEPSSGSYPQTTSS